MEGPNKGAMEGPKKRPREVPNNRLSEVGWGHRGSQPTHPTLSDTPVLYMNYVEGG